MSTRMRILAGFFSALLLAGGAVNAQVPVDASGNPVPATAADGEIPALSAEELDELVGPIALYPDDLLAIVLPASTYPLQIVQAARFVEDLEHDKSLKPDESWDDSVVALTNYPEVLQMMNDDLDWTWRLGEAMVAQQTDVIQAIEDFRDRAYAAGNLKSDEYQVVTNDDGVIEIEPAQEDVIYVPYYEPERVVVYQPRRVYYYYPRAYPVYYYPYPAGYAFDAGYFWGVTTAFSIGWHSHHLRLWHHSYHGHPYYGYHYWPRWWYRSPDIHVHNTYYVNNRPRVTKDRYRRGDYWQPRDRRTVRRHDQRVTRSRYYPGVTTADTRTSSSTYQHSGSNRPVVRKDQERSVRDRSRQRTAAATTTRDTRPEIRFRERATSPRSSGNRNPTVARADRSQRQTAVRPDRPQRQTVTRNQPSQRSLVPRQSGSRSDAGVNRAPERRQPAATRRAPQRQPTVSQSRPKQSSAPSRRSEKAARQPQRSESRSRSSSRERSPSRSRRSTTSH